MIRRLIKWFFRFCLLLIAGIVVLLLCKDAIIRKIAEHRIEARTGLRAKIGKIHIGFTEPVITLKEFKLYNRPEFGGFVLVHIPELHVEYDPDKFRSARLRLKLLRLNLAELNIVRNAAGQTNILSLLREIESNGVDSLSRSEPARQLGFAGIDKLHLSLGKFRYLDLGDPSKNREANFKLRDFEIGNIRSEDDLSALAALVLMRSGVVNLDLKSGDDNASASPFQAGWDLVKRWVGLVREVKLPGSTNQLTDTVHATPP